MKNYYIDPKTRNLVVHDLKENEIYIFERVNKVRMFVEGELRLADFDGNNPDDVPEKFDKHGAYLNPHLHDGGNFPRKANATRGIAKEQPDKKPRKKAVCKSCGGGLHGRGTCPAKADRSDGSNDPGPEVLRQIREGSEADE